MRYFAVSREREVKAGKIEAVLCAHLGLERIDNRRILDLGCGSGHIAAFFSRSNEVVAADVVNQIAAPVCDTVPFRQIDSALLPFEDGAFDIVIFNHVLYCMPDQLGELREIHRVLRKGGICYLASANRYFPVEGFTRLPLLHYLPGRVFRGLYKKIRSTGDELYPVGYHGIKRLIMRAGFSYREYTEDIIRNPAKYHSEYRVPSFLPVPQCVSPTVVFILGK